MPFCCSLRNNDHADSRSFTPLSASRWTRVLICAGNASVGACPTRARSSLRLKGIRQPNSEYRRYCHRGKAPMQEAGCYGSAVARRESAESRTCRSTAKCRPHPAMCAENSQSIVRAGHSLDRSAAVINCCLAYCDDHDIQAPLQISSHAVRMVALSA